MALGAVAADGRIPSTVVPPRSSDEPRVRAVVKSVTKRVDDLVMVTDPLARACAAILTRHPDAPVAAMGPDGISVDVPASLGLVGRRELRARSALDLVVPADRVVLINAWSRVKEVGIARTPIRLCHDPDHVVHLHLVDLSEAHGVFLGVFADGGGGADEAVATGAGELVAPRFARTHKDEMAVLTEIDEATTQILGWSSEEMVGARSLDFIHPDDQQLAIDNWMEMLAATGMARRVRLRHAAKNGEWVWLEITNHNRLLDPAHGDVLAEMVDITDEMATHQALEARERLLYRLAETIPIGVLQVNRAGTVLYANQRVQELTGTGPATTFVAQLATVVAEDRGTVADALAAVLDQGRDRDVEIRIQTEEGSIRYCEARLRALTGAAGEVSGAIVCMEDVSQRVQMRQELEWRATIDPLTGCHNRGSTMALLDKIVADAPDRAKGLAVIFCDLDRFKPVNDQYGHATGDELLVAVAQRLIGTARDGDIVGRIGGDEFLLLCPDVESSEHALTIAYRISARLAEAFALRPGRVGVGVSIGVVWADRGAGDPESLVAAADRAMYESKRRGGHQPVLVRVGGDHDGAVAEGPEGR